uniref:Uncharacterized protein n=1 Tax=Aplanochytrium stocchinoi TaxID=215587 RepID=A0A7S3PJY4_9STRA
MDVPKLLDKNLDVSAKEIAKRNKSSNRYIGVPISSSKNLGVSAKGQPKRSKSSKKSRVNATTNIEKSHSDRKPKESKNPKHTSTSNRNGRSTSTRLSNNSGRPTSTRVSNGELGHKREEKPKSPNWKQSTKAVQSTNLMGQVRSDVLGTPVEHIDNKVPKGKGHKVMRSMDYDV